MKIKTELFPYQRTAYEKLIKLKVGALYMEMGTGKTRTALELVCTRLTAGKIEKVIWLCPCSVKANLARDIEKHADDWQNIITICGIETLSTSVREIARLKNISDASKTMLIVDESNLVKNPFALRSVHIIYIANSCNYRIILNGTPISRNEADMFNQWYLLDKRILGYESYYSFARNHLEYDERTHQIRRVLNVNYLTDKIAPYSVQIKKSDVLELPDKITHIMPYAVTPRQHMHYEIVLDDFLSSELLGKGNESVIVYRTLTALSEVASGRIITTPADKPIKHKAMYENPRDNPRIQALYETIGIYSKNEKSIIWCKYAHEIKTIAELLKSDGYKAAQFYGELPNQKRQAELKNFETDAQFLIANKSCAGYGLNLQYCHNAIYYTNDFDWATRAQSEDRIHRIGQKDRVTLIDICSNLKIDERILNCLYRKENLSDRFKEQIASKNAADWLRGESDLSDIDRIERKSKA